MRKRPLLAGRGKRETASSRETSMVAAFSIRFAAANGQLLTTELTAELTCGKTLPGHAD